MTLAFDTLLTSLTYDLKFEVYTSSYSTEFRPLEN